MRPYGLKKGGRPATIQPDCCPGHSEWPCQSKESHKVGGRHAGRRPLKKRLRQEVKKELREGE